MLGLFQGLLIYPGSRAIIQMTMNRKYDASGHQGTPEGTATAIAFLNFLQQPFNDLSLREQGARIQLRLVGPKVLHQLGAPEVLQGKLDRHISETAQEAQQGK